MKRNRILVVDDEVVLREILRYEFEKAGFEVFEAGSGNEGWDMFRSKPTDVVVTDIRMPNGDGLELLDRIKEKDKTARVVLVTGYSDISLDEAKQRGASAMLGKPYQFKELLDAVNGHLH